MGFVRFILHMKVERHNWEKYMDHVINTYTKFSRLAFENEIKGIQFDHWYYLNNC